MTRKSSRGLVAVTYERWSFASLLGAGLNWRKNRPVLFSAPFVSRPFRLTLSAPGSPRTVCEMSNIFVFWLDGRLIKGEVVKHGGFTVLLQTIQNDFYVSDPNSLQYELSKARLQL